jgi:hypothetical protein
MPCLESPEIVLSVPEPIGHFFDLLKPTGNFTYRKYIGFVRIYVSTNSGLKFLHTLYLKCE